ncbi:MAG: UDP-glucose 4-epimerase GalE [bacterium]
MKKQILVAGGAGYIGSHCVRYLINKGYYPVTLDNLSRGHSDSVNGSEMIKADLSRPDQIRTVFANHDFYGVMHFAAYCYVGESFENPAAYYGNNVANIINLLNVMRSFHVSNIIFSSTCATYGLPVQMPISEDHPQNPVSPYGKSKLMCEQIIKDYSSAYGMNYIFFRYFNASGANISADIGERHKPETHLIPLALRTALGLEPSLKILGTDYDTPDGTCIRDYIHVDDIASAHLLGLNYLAENGINDMFNLGNGNGYSVKEVVETCREVTGIDIPTVKSERRPGDPSKLIASAEKVRNVLGWDVKYLNLKDIVSTAWQWHKKAEK